MIRKPVIALLGRPDTPTDAVEEYCNYLGEALREKGFELHVRRADWTEKGWARTLRRRLIKWRGEWIIVQYTALAWSKRGFPRRFLKALKTLKSIGVRVGVVYHDAEPFAGPRLIDAVRRRIQLGVMQKALELADAAVFTIPLEKIPWLEQSSARICFIPVGANLPVPRDEDIRRAKATDGRLTVAVFGITGGASGQWEMDAISAAVRFAVPQLEPFRLLAMGRNAKDYEASLRERFKDVPVDLQVKGVLPAPELASTLAGSDVLLFVRGPISSRRGSAIAGIACGLPVIAFEGPETAPPITEAGLALFSLERKGDLGRVLLHVLQDEHYRTSLAQRSLLAQRDYFSWHAIAASYAKFLQD